MVARYIPPMLRFFIAVAMIPFLTLAAINYNKKYQICCGATAFDKGNFTGCCGKRLYSYTEALCCGNQVFPYSELGIAGPKWQVGCCSSSSGEGEPFDRETHYCCGGKSLEKPDKNALYACCSEKLYAQQTHHCCDGNLHDLVNGNACCGDKTYNSSSRICCQRRVKNGESLVGEFSELHPYQDHWRTSCCGSAVYDTSKEVCCNDKILQGPGGIFNDDTMCCEDRVVDIHKYLCCRSNTNNTDFGPDSKGKVLEMDGPYSRCCGLTVFDMRYQICCNNTVLPKPANVKESAQGSCCGNQIQTSSLLQLCINNKLFDRNSTDYFICGDEGKLYNVYKQTCCYGNVLENGGDIKCCYYANKSYDSKKEICCTDGINLLTAEDIKEGRFECCV